MANRFFVLPFRIGYPAATLLNQAFKTAYESAARVLIGDQQVIPQVPDLTIPAYYGLLENTDVAHRSISAAMAKCHDDASLIIIDLANPNDEILANHRIAAALIAIVKEQPQRFSHRKYLLLLPTILAHADLTMQILRPLVESGRLSLLSDAGDLLSTSEAIEPFKTKYRNDLRRARGSLFTRLGEKLLRFPGHFKRRAPDGRDYCTEFFFDGRLCRPELVDLLDQRVAEIQTQAPDAQIVFHSTISKWFENAVEGLSERLGTVSKDFDSLLQDPGTKVVSDIILLLPLIDTQETIRFLIEQIRNFHRKPKIHIISILSTDGGEDTNGSLQIEVRQEIFQIRYFLKVNQVRHTSTECPQCLRGVPATDTANPDPLLKFNSHSFWKLAREVGFEAEQNVPANRRGLGWVPQFQNLSGSSAAYVAWKVDRALRIRLGASHGDSVIVCPHQSGARAVAQSLERVFNFVVITVPKDALDLVEQHGPDDAYELLKNSYDHANPIWFQQLSSLRSQLVELRIAHLEPRDHNKIIALDEINVSGQTRSQLRLLVHSFQLGALGYVSLVDFNPNDPRVDIHNSFSLYDIDIPETVWQSE
jgi:hypothetical protein